MNKGILKFLLMSCMYFVNPLCSMNDDLYTKEDQEAIVLAQGHGRDGFLDPDFLTKMKTAIGKIKKNKNFENATIPIDEYFDTIIFFNEKGFDRYNPEFYKLNQKYSPEIEFYPAMGGKHCALNFNQPMDIFTLRNIYTEIFKDGTQVQLKKTNIVYNREAEIIFTIEENLWMFTVNSNTGCWTAEYDPMQEKIIRVRGWYYNILPSCNIL